MATASFLFILVGVLCLRCQESTFFYPLSKKRCTLLPEDADVHIQMYLLHYIIMARQLLNWQKTQTRNLTVFMMLVIWTSSTLKFLFVFGFSWCLWAICSLNLERFWFYIWVVVLWLLISHFFWFYFTSYSCPWIQKLNAKTTKYIPNCWERSVKRNSNLSFIEL